MNARRFDWITDPAVAWPTTEWDLEIFGSRHFSVVPSLGSLLPGWLLIVPRRPLLNLRGLSPDEFADLERLRARLRGRLSALPGTIFEFEHGSLHAGSATGCGVDQAHLHMVPLPFDLIKGASDLSSQRVEWLHTGYTGNPWSLIPQEREYVLIHRDGGPSVIGAIILPESQWLRKVIAQKLSPVAEWDYKTNPCLGNIRHTIRMFEPYAPICLH